MIAKKNCPTCGAEISADAVDGLCPKCLGRLAFSRPADDAESSELRRLGDYELLEEIARGGMGVVYRARQLSLNRIVAVKVVLNGPFSGGDFLRRFQTEARAAAALAHPNIVAVHEVGEHGGAHFLSMEFVEGKNFSELVRDQPLPARRAANYLRTIALALQHAHERGVLHRDLKPSNILLDVFDQPRVTDFGLAKLAQHDAELTLPGSVLGSPNFIPPEQAAGNFSRIAAHSDVYSLGAILYQLLTGRPPFQGETLHEILRQVQDAEPVPPRKLNPSVPPDLQTICLKCLQKEPARRYRTARDLADDLEFFLAGKPICARPVAPLESAWLWCKRRPALAAMWLALAVAIGGGLAGVLYEWQQADQHAQGERQQRLAAEKNTETKRLNLYAADVALAGQLMQAGDFSRAHRTLEQASPLAGETDLRGFEWRYLWSLCQSNQLITLGRHEWIVTAVTYSPDGKTIASGGMGGQVKIWDDVKRECRQTINAYTGAVWSVAYTPDGKTLMTAGTGGVFFWNTETWAVQTNFPGNISALSADGNLLAVSESSPFYFDEPGRVTLWNWRTGERLRTLAEPGRALALSPDGRWLAVATVTNGINFYETASGKLLRTLPTKMPVWSLNFSAEGTELLSAGWSNEALLWNLAGDFSARNFSANYLIIWNARFAPDGKTILTTSSDQTIRFWDRATLAPKDILRGHTSEVWCAAFRPDGQEIVTGSKDQSVMLWSATAPAPPPDILQQDYSPPLFSPAGRQLLTINPTTAVASGLWNLNTRTLLGQDLARRHPVVGFSRDSRFIVTLDDDQCALEFWLPTADAPAQVVALAGRTPSSPALGFWGMSPEQEFFFAIDATGTGRVWDTATGIGRQVFAGPPPPIRNAVLSPHGKFLAVSVERQNNFFLYDCDRAKLSSLSGHQDFVSGLAFSPDNATLATGSMDGTIRFWSTADARTAGSLPGHIQETSDVAFSPDGRTLASVSQRESLKLWHLPTMREVFSQVLPHAGWHLRFSPDGRVLVVNTDDGKLLLYDAP